MDTMEATIRTFSQGVQGMYTYAASSITVGHCTCQLRSGHTTALWMQQVMTGAMRNAHVSSVYTMLWLFLLGPVLPSSVGRCMLYVEASYAV